MIETVFLVVPRSTDGASAAEMVRIVDDVKDHIFDNYDEVKGFVFGRCYDKGDLWSMKHMTDAHNTGSRKLSESLIFPLYYENGAD